MVTSLAPIASFDACSRRSCRRWALLLWTLPITACPGQNDAAHHNADSTRERFEAAVLRRMADAVSAGDASRYASLYGDNAVIVIAGGATLRGRAAIEQYEVGLLREYPGTQLAFFDVWRTDSLTIAHYGVSGRAATGLPMGHEGLLFYDFDSAGRIIEERRYNDSMTPMAQSGMFGAVESRSVPMLPPMFRYHDDEASPADRDNLATVRQTYAALDSRDIDGFIALLADSVVVDELVYPRVFAGKNGVKSWWDLWVGGTQGVTNDIIGMTVVGEFVLVETVMRGTLNGRIGHVRATNKPFSIRRASIIQVRRGRITRIANFMNGLELAKAVGAWAPPIPAARSSTGRYP
jgi:ketosteroid isomerase-like protein